MNQIMFSIIPTDCKDQEHWKLISDFPSYYVSDLGRVWSVKRKKLLKQWVNAHGYCRVNLSRYGRTKKYSTHRLVAEAFIPNPEGKPCVNHINGVKTDNCLSNLEWTTYSENTKHAFDTGLRITVPGFTNEVKEKIRRLWATGDYTQQELSEMFGFSKDCIWYCVKDIESPRSRGPYKHISEETKLKIIQLWETKQYSQRKLAKIFNVSRYGVQRCISS